MATIEGERVDAQELDLRDVLDRYSDIGPKLDWRLTVFQGVGDLSTLGTRVVELEKEVAATEGGKPVSWEWLLQLADLLWDLIDIELFAFASPEATEPTVAFELFDSSYWTMSSVPAVDK